MRNIISTKLSEIDVKNLIALQKKRFYECTVENIPNDSDSDSDNDDNNNNNNSINNNSITHS